ncbi:OmpA family protein [Flavobacteriaceae bacterium]|nr:OmpA family protein [Flavobacteriaceae bacterium]
MFPFIDQDGTFYFSSNGHPNLGGLDVFQTSASDIGETVANLGRPINSSYDDFAYVVEGDSGYFASNRDNQNDNIYSFNQLKKTVEEAPCQVVYKGVIRDQSTGQPIPNAKLEFISCYLENVGHVTTDDQGRYSFEDENCDNVSIIQADKMNYFTDQAVVSGKNGGVVNTDISLKKHEKSDITQSIDSGMVEDLAIFIGPIHFDLDKSNIRLNAAVELDKIVSIMEEHPTLEIDVRSHTDSRNDDAYNMALSERRNKATIQYLVDKGISRSRLTGRGYGETQLVNHCSNGVQCPDEVHEQNRRSEFIITKR